MKAKVLMTLLLSAVALPVLAGEAIDGMFIGAAVKLAQLGPEERQMLRERWEQASPEQRMEMRRLFQERLQSVSPDEREAQRRQSEPRRGEAPQDQRNRQREGWTGRLPNPAGDLSGFGTGFERRRSGPWPVPEAVQELMPRFEPFAPQPNSANPAAGRDRR